MKRLLTLSYLFLRHRRLLFFIESPEHVPDDSSIPENPDLVFVVEAENSRDHPLRLRICFAVCHLVD